MASPDYCCTNKNSERNASSLFAPEVGVYRMDLQEEYGIGPASMPTPLIHSENEAGR